MTEAEKIDFYNLHKLTILPTIKAESKTKALWRRLFWTTAKNSNLYKAGCIDILMNNFPDLYTSLKKQGQYEAASGSSYS